MCLSNSLDGIGKNELTKVADGKTLVSISRANLPDPIELPSSRQRSSRKSTPTEEASSKEHNTEIMCIRSGPVQSRNAPQPSFAPGDTPANLSMNRRSTTHSPTQFIKRDQPIHPEFDPTVAPMSAQDQKRKRQRVEMGVPITSSPTSLGYYSPVYVGSQPFVPDSYHDLQGFQPQSGPTTVQPNTESFGETMESLAFPYYFDC